MLSPKQTLLLSIAGLLVLWIVVLPHLGRQPSVRRHIERNREHQIHPDAMFYTEVGPLEGVTVEHRGGRVVIGKIRMSPAERQPTGGGD